MWVAVASLRLIVGRCPPCRSPPGLPFSLTFLPESKRFKIFLSAGEYWWRYLQSVWKMSEFSLKNVWKFSGKIPLELCFDFTSAEFFQKILSCYSRGNRRKLPSALHRRVCLYWHHPGYHPAWIHHQNCAHQQTQSGFHHCRPWCTIAQFLIFAPLRQFVCGQGGCFNFSNILPDFRTFKGVIFV